MRLLWFGDLAPSGFGSVTTDLGRALLDLGHDVRFLSQNDLEGIPPEPFGSRVLDLAFYEIQTGAGGRDAVAGIKDLVGGLIAGSTADVMLASGDPWGDWRPDAVVLLGDFWAVRVLADRFETELRLAPVYHYVPIEGTSLPPRWSELWSWIHPIAMSRFGAEQIAAVTGRMPPMVYHGVDTKVFHPASPTDPVVVPIDRDRTKDVRIASRDAARRFFMGKAGSEGQFWFLRTDRNMPRKRFGAMLRAMTPVLAAHSEARLVLHCRTWDQGGDLRDEISKMPPSIAHQVMLPEIGAMPREVLVALYNASDAYVSSGPEGFGLCVDPETPIAVPGGVKPMREIDTGDEVLTRDGFRPVVGRLSRTAERVEVRCVGVPPLRVTPEHPFLSISRGRSRPKTVRARLGSLRPEWTRADRLRKGDLVATPRPRWDRPLPTSIDLADFVGEDFSHDDTHIWHPMGFSPRQPGRLSISEVVACFGVSRSAAERGIAIAAGHPVDPQTAPQARDVAVALRGSGQITRAEALRLPRWIPIDADLLELMGWYLAEGSPNGGGGIELDLSDGEWAIAERLVVSIERIFGIRAVIQRRRHAHVLRVWASSRVVSTLFTAMCGEGARSKRLHPMLWQSAIHLGPLIGAYTLGDGHAKVGGYAITTGSQDLAWQLHSVCAAAGIFMRLSRHSNARGFSGGGDAWVLSCEGEMGERFAGWTGLPIRERGRRKRGSHQYVTDDMIYTTVRATTSIGHGEVMDISVGGMHEFVGGGLLLHNTIAEALACGIPAIGLNYSAVPEVIGPGGIVVPPAFLYDNEYNHFWAAPDEEKMTEAAMSLIEHPARARAMGQEGIRHVRSTFRWSEAARVIADAIVAGPVAAQRIIEPTTEPVIDPLTSVPQDELVVA